MSDYDNKMNINDLDTATPLDGASAVEVYAAIRQIKSLIKNVLLVSLDPSGRLKTNGSIVSSGTISEGAVTNEKLGADAVTSSKIANEAVTTVHLIDALVTTAKLMDSSVTTLKLAGGAVTGAKIASQAVGVGKLVVTTNDDDRPVVTDSIRDQAVTNDKISGLSVEKLTGGLSGQVVRRTDEGVGWGDADGSTTSSQLAMALVVDSKASGTSAGGPALAATWTERDLGQGIDPEDFMQFVGNSFQLSEGSYLFHIVVPGHNGGSHQARLLKTANSDSGVTTVAIGTTAKGIDQQTSTIIGALEVSDSSDSFKVEHWMQTANTVDGFGAPASTGENEVYTQGWFVKIS